MHRLGQLPLVSADSPAPRGPARRVAVSAPEGSPAHAGCTHYTGADTSHIPCGRSPHRPSAFDACPIRSWKPVVDRRRCTGRRALCSPRDVCTWGTAGPPSPRRGSPPCNTGHRTDYRFERRPEGANPCRIDRGAGRLPPRAAAAGEAVRRLVALPEGASADWRDYPRTAEATRAQTSAHRQQHSLGAIPWGARPQGQAGWTPSEP